MKIKNSIIDKYGVKLIELTKTKSFQEAFTLLGYQAIHTYHATFLDKNNKEFTIHFNGSNRLSYKLLVKKTLMNNDIIESLLSLYNEKEILDKDFLNSIPDSLIMNYEAMNTLTSNLDQEKKAIMFTISDYKTIGEYIEYRRQLIKDKQNKKETKMV